PPLRFRWRRALHEVIFADGPERIEGAWWSESGGQISGNLARDYFRVEDRSGLRFWLFRAGLYRDLTPGGAPPSWFVHGMFACASYPLPLWERVARDSAPGEGEMPRYRVEEYKRTQAKTLRHAMTEAELYLWQLLRSRQISDLKFRRQVPVGPWIADFVCFEHMLIVEADGSQHAESRRDEIRDADLRRRGFRILRFWNN